ncbi:MAG TPA: FtsQ-type POTRA domain-containing protein [Actinomycetota bacterium]|nr:FtsQ-type POTRA domain-containing protein [Actinomycetota bacterium]
MARERRWPVAAAIAVLLVVTLAAVAAALTYTSLFRATRIRVEGSSRPDATVIAAAGLAGEVNVFHLDAGAAEAALLADPWVKAAEVRRALPHGVVIEVRERVPVLAVGERAVAADGTELPGAVASDLPRARGTMGEIEASQVPAAAAAAAALSPALREQVGYVVIGLDGDLSLRLDDGPSVRWGRGDEQAAAKAAALEALLRYADERDRVILTADVSAPKAPSARFDD